MERTRKYNRKRGGLNAKRKWIYSTITNKSNKWKTQAVSPHNIANFSLTINGEEQQVDSVYQFNKTAPVKWAAITPPPIPPLNSSLNKISTMYNKLFSEKQWNFTVYKIENSETAILLRITFSNGLFNSNPKQLIKNQLIKIMNVTPPGAVSLNFDMAASSETQFFIIFKFKNTMEMFLTLLATDVFGKNGIKQKMDNIKIESNKKRSQSVTGTANTTGTVHTEPTEQRRHSISHINTATNQKPTLSPQLFNNSAFESLPKSTGTPSPPPTFSPHLFNNSGFKPSQNSALPAAGGTRKKCSRQVRHLKK